MQAMPRADELDAPERREVHLPLSTIVKVLLTLFALWAIYELATVIALVLIAVVLAVALEPVGGVVGATTDCARWVAATLTVFVLVGCLVGFWSCCAGRRWHTQARQLTDRIGSVQKDLIDRLPPAFARVGQEYAHRRTIRRRLRGYAMSLGGALVECCARRRRSPSF